MIKAPSLNTVRQQHHTTASQATSTPAASSQPTTTESPVARDLVDRFVPSLAESTVAADEAKMRSLRTKLTGVNLESVQVGADGRAKNLGSEAGATFQTNNFGRVVSSGANNDPLGIGASPSTSSRNPIPSLVSQMQPGGAALASDGDPSSKPKGVVDTVLNAIADLLSPGKKTDNSNPPPSSTPDGGGGTRDSGGESTAGEVAREALGAAVGYFSEAAGPMWSILNGTKETTLDGVRGLYRQGSGGTLNENENNMLNHLNSNKDPVPADVSEDNGPPHITAGMVDAVGKMLNQRSTPNPDDSNDSSGYGKINTGADGTGKLGSQSQPNPVSDTSLHYAATRADMDAIRAKLTANISLVH